jgi:signal peptidase I
MSLMSDETEASPAFKKSVAREYLESIVVAVILALFIRTFAVQAFKIPTGSMENNLLIGDHLLVNKLVYSPSAGRFEDVLMAKRPIARGHVVVFKFPEDPTRDFIKRVIGLPGETVEIRNKKVYIDGEPLDEPYVHFLDPPRSADDPEFGLRIDGIRDNWGPRVVPEGELLVLGDNRDNSRDSRFWGFLPIDQVKGRALIVYWSYEATREEYHRTGWLDWIKDTFSAFGRTRWDRFFHVIR